MGADDITRDGSTTRIEAPELLMIGSARLLAAAQRMRDTEVPRAMLRNGVTVTPAQLERAAEIVTGGPKTQITSGSADRAAHEIPVFIHRDQQDDPAVLCLTHGVLGRDYWIDLAGTVIGPNV